MQFLGAGEGGRLHLGAGALLVRPEREKPPDLLDRKAEVAGVGDKAEAGDVGRRIVAIARVAARRRGDEADLLIVADHPLRDAARLRGRANITCLTLLSLSRLATPDRKDCV